jgi:hypothetical protein
MRTRLVPVATYLVSNLVTWIAAALSGRDYFNPLERAKWDSQHYLSIARTGYESFRCIDRYANWPDIWCGNTAWFPGYPMAIRSLSWLGLPAELAGVVVSEVFFLGAMLLLWRLFDRKINATSIGAMALAAVFPGSIYSHVVFGVSMCLYGLLLALVGLREQRWWVAALGGFVALSVHIVGVIAVGAVAASLLFGWQRFTWPGRLWRVAAATVGGGLALLWSLWTIYRDTGSWTIYFQHQDESFHNLGWHDPLEQLVRFYKIQFRHSPAVADHWLTAHSLSAHQPQLVLNVVICLLILGSAGWLAWKRELQPWQGAAVLMVLGAMMMPLTSGAWSAWYRHDALMLVGVTVLRLPRPAWVLLVGISGLQTLFLSGMWFGGSLI